jgi:ganglioside-induced differentiation-associated protein 1
MLTLYDFGNSVCCQKVRITMCAKALTWESIKVDLFKAEQYDARYLTLNRRGIVPTLVHDGKAIVESTLICEYLDDTFPEPRLIPSDPWQRTRMRLWSKMVDEGLFEGGTELSFSAMFRERMRAMPEEIRERRFRNIGDPRRRDRFMSTYELGVRSPYVRHGIAAYERAFKLLEDTLSESGPWILGANPSLADVNLMPFAARLDYLGLIDLWIEDRPRVKHWWALARDWPSFKSGLRDLISESEFSEMKTHGPKIAGDVAEIIAEVRRDTATAVKDSSG